MNDIKACKRRWQEATQRGRERTNVVAAAVRACGAARQRRQRKAEKVRLNRWERVLRKEKVCTNVHESKRSRKTTY